MVSLSPSINNVEVSLEESDTERQQQSSPDPLQPAVFIKVGMVPTKHWEKCDSLGSICGDGFKPYLAYRYVSL